MKTLQYLTCGILLFSLIACNKDDVKPTYSLVSVGFDTTYMEVKECIGYAEIPVKLEGTLANSINFKVSFVDGTAVSSGNEWDYKVPETKIKVVKGNMVGVVRVDLHDWNTQKENRSFKLRITEVAGTYKADTVSIRENASECEVVILKVEPEATFGKSKIVVDETSEPFDFVLELKRPVDRDVSITFQPKAGATAIEGTHFRLNTHNVTIKKGETTASAIMNIINEPYGNIDRVCNFEITEVTGNVDIARDAECRLIIKNDDSSIGFGQRSMASHKGLTAKVPIRLNGLRTKRVVVDVVGSMEGGVTQSDYYTITNNKVEIPEGDSVAYAEVQFKNPNVSDFFVELKIDKITVDDPSIQVPLQSYAKTCKFHVMPTPIVSASSSAPANGNQGGVEFLMDGNKDTYWQSQLDPAAQLPQWVQVDFGVECRIDSVKIWRRSGLEEGGNDIKTCTLQLSSDNITWNDMETYTFTEASDKYRCKRLWHDARYVRYYITESNRPPFVGIAEIEIYKSPK